MLIFDRNMKKIHELVHGKKKNNATMPETEEQLYEELKKREQHRKLPWRERPKRPKMHTRVTGRSLRTTHT